MQPFGCRHRGQYIFKRSYKITSSNFLEIFISRLELQRWSLEFCICFSKIYFIQDLGVRIGQLLLGSLIQISFRAMYFQDLHIIPTVKRQNLFLNHLLLKFKFLFSRNTNGCQLWIFILDADLAQIYTFNKADKHIGSITCLFYCV